MQLRDALCNWLQIKIVLEKRPDDKSAHKTVCFFVDLLHEDHHVKDISYQQCDNEYLVTYQKEDKKYDILFAQDIVEQLLVAILAEPKYQ